MQTKYFEDFLIGERIETSGITLTEAQIIDFALMYDPQPFHRRYRGRCQGSLRRPDRQRLPNAGGDVPAAPGYGHHP